MNLAIPAQPEYGPVGWLSVGLRFMDFKKYVSRSIKIWQKSVGCRGCTIFFQTTCYFYRFLKIWFYLVYAFCESRPAMECVGGGYKPTDWPGNKPNKHGYFRQPDSSDYRLLLWIFKIMVLSSVRVFGSCHCPLGTLPNRAFQRPSDVWRNGFFRQLDFRLLTTFMDFQNVDSIQSTRFFASRSVVGGGYYR